MRSAVEDKVRRALADEYQTKQVEVASLCRIKEELNNSQNKLKSSLAQLDKDNTELNELCTSLKEEHNSLVKVSNIPLILSVNCSRFFYTPLINLWRLNTISLH